MSPERYKTDPVAFVRDFMKLYPYQAAHLDRFVAAVRSGKPLRLKTQAELGREAKIAAAMVLQGIRQMGTI